MEKFRKLRAQLRGQIDRGELKVAIGAQDALAARVLERAGYDVVLMGGHAVSAAMLAWTDVGMMSETEVLSTARNICNAVNIPLIADVDTGYGNAVNMVRTVRDFEQAGVAMIQVEDQEMPKKCGFMKGKALISKEEMVGKIKAAVAAREDPNFMICARCDARAVEGPESMYDRLAAYSEAGADLLYPEAPRHAEDVREDAKRLKGLRSKLYLIGVGLGSRYGMTFKDVADLGFSLLVIPEPCMTVMAKAFYDVVVEMKKTGTYPDYVKQGKMMTVEELEELIRLPEVQRLEQTYLPADVKMQRWKSEDLPGASTYFIREMQSSRPHKAAK